MTKARITIVNVVEFEINQNNYVPGSSIDECLKYEIEHAEEDPTLFFELEQADIKITGEILSS